MGGRTDVRGVVAPPAGKSTQRFPQVGVTEHPGSLDHEPRARRSVECTTDEKRGRGVMSSRESRDGLLTGLRIGVLEPGLEGNVNWRTDSLAYANACLRNRDEAEDTVQEAFVRVVGRLGHVRNVDAFDGYLRRTVVNLTKNAWRRRALERRHAEPVDAEETARPTDAPVLERIVVFRALATLPSRQRIALALRYYEDLPVEEIASIMRCPSGTVRSLLSRGAAAMRTAMEDHDDA